MPAKERMMVITRVNPLSAAKVAGLLYVVVGLIAGALFSLVAMGGAALGAAGGEDSAMFGALFGVGAIILLPICYGIFGFIGTLIMTWLFNIAAGMVGGLEIDAR
jgi:hypothetical protein